MKDFWKNRRVFLTGCTGLTGYWLAERLLSEGAEVTGLVRDFVPKSNLYRFKLDERINRVEGKVEDYFLLERTINEYKTDTVFHLGAQTQVDMGNRNPLPTFETNIKGSWNILEACRRNEQILKRIIVASSVNAYGQQDKLPYTENAPLRGAYPYEVSKSCTDLISYTYFNTYNLPVCITRCGNIYGPGDLNFERLIPGTIKSVLHNEPIIIRSDGTLKRDYFYVKDAVNAYVTLAEKLEELSLAGEVFNFSSGCQISVLDMVNKILDVMGKKEFPVKILNEAKGEIKDQYMSIDKAKKILGWYPAFSMEDALRESSDWYRTFL